MNIDFSRGLTLGPEFQVTRGQTLGLKMSNPKLHA